MEHAFARDVEEVTSFFNVDLNQGLNERDAIKARTKYGRNELLPDKGTPFWKLVLKQFDDTLVKILLAAAVVDFIIALSDGETFFSSMVEPSVILMILLVNATVGVVTERNAEKAIEELKAYEAESAVVLREGKLLTMPASDLVPGDVVQVAVGDSIPADIRLCKLIGNVLRVDQSILTGESHTVDKFPDAVPANDAVVQDKTCMLYSGTMVTTGKAIGVVVATGQSTAIGQIRDAMSDQEDVVTPLKQKLDEFGELLSKVIAAICVLVWLMNINRFTDPALGGWAHGAIYYFKIAVALAVAAIPEGLPAVVTTCLALGTRKMAKQNAIVRSLPSVETLGCTTVICTDKTGTLTTNQMAVVKACVVQSELGGVEEYSVTGTTYSATGAVLTSDGARVERPARASPCLLHVAICSTLCNDSNISYREDTGTLQHIGEATEVALRVFAEKVGMLDDTPDFLLPHGQRTPICNSYWKDQYPREAALDFTRDRKMMSVLCSNAGNYVMFTKGAPESVLARCRDVLLNDGSGVTAMRDDMKRTVLQKMESYGTQDALRCLALAFKHMPKNVPYVSKKDEEGLIFLGLVAMHDPPRQECRAALELCRQAGIRVIMVTGDNQATAEAVGRQVGALPEEHEIGSSYTGAQFDKLSALDQVEAVGTMRVFSRVEPLHKLRLVEALRAQGAVVAMTGDGVNDAPALVKADIGVAMGSGTAVAKHAADMVLADDNFATIVSAVAEGRAIYNNTKQFIRYMISSNIGEVVAIFVAALLGIPEVLTPVQLLWVNLVTDGLPATALGFNHAERDLMLMKPRRAADSIVNGWLFFRYLVVGVYVGLATVYGFVWWFVQYPGGPKISFQDLNHFQSCTHSHSTNAKTHSVDCSVFSSKHPKTIAMSVLVVVEMFNALNNLSENTSLLRIPPWDNKWLLGAISLSMSLHFAILYIEPLAHMFDVTGLNKEEWKLVLWVSFPVIIVDELLKYFSRRIQQSQRSNRSSRVTQEPHRYKKDSA